jgi:hypothetical protein
VYGVASLFANRRLVRNTILLSMSLWVRQDMRILTALQEKNAVFWDVTPPGSCKNRCFGGTIRFHHEGEKNAKKRRFRNVFQLLVTDNLIYRTPNVFTLMREAIISTESRLLQQPHCVTFQKTAFFIVTAAKTSNLIKFRIIRLRGHTLDCTGTYPRWQESSTYISYSQKIKRDLCYHHAVCVHAIPFMQFCTAQQIGMKPDMISEHISTEYFVSQSVFASINLPFCHC